MVWVPNIEPIFENMVCKTLELTGKYILSQSNTLNSKDISDRAYKHGGLVALLLHSFYLAYITF